RPSPTGPPAHCPTVPSPASTSTSHSSAPMRSTSLGGWASRLSTRRGPRSSSPTGPKTSSYSPTVPKRTVRLQPGHRCPTGGVGSTRTESGHRVEKVPRNRSSPDNTLRSDTIKSATELTSCQPHSRNDNFTVPCEENLSLLSSHQ